MMQFVLPTSNLIYKDQVSKLHKYKLPQKKLWKQKGYVLNPKHEKYLELAEKTSRKKKKQKKQTTTTKTIPVYQNKLFDEWQNRLSESIHNGYDVIIDVATSCGKTWAVNMIISYETLSRKTDNALFIIPNRLLLLDNVKDICENHYKKYQYDKPMLQFETKKFKSLQNNNYQSQIQCITADMAELFLTSVHTQEFLSNMKYIVFDEVHLPNITKLLWMFSFIPNHIQFIILSATIGNSNEIKQLLIKHRRHEKIKIIRHKIRPVPLQRILFNNNQELHPDGFLISKNDLKDSSSFSCQIISRSNTSRYSKNVIYYES